MVLQPGQQDTNEIQDAPSAGVETPELGIETVEEGLEIIKEIGGVGARMSMRVNELAAQVAEGDPDREEADAAIIELAEAFLEWKEADHIVRAPNDEVLNEKLV